MNDRELKMRLGMAKGLLALHFPDVMWAVGTTSIHHVHSEEWPCVKGAVVGTGAKIILMLMDAGEVIRVTVECGGFTVLITSQPTPMMSVKAALEAWFKWYSGLAESATRISAIAAKAS